MKPVRPALLAFSLFAAAATQAQSRANVFGILHDSVDVEMLPDSIPGHWRCEAGEASIRACFDGTEKIRTLSLFHPGHSVELAFTDNADGTRGVTQMISGDGDEKRELQTWERIDDPDGIIARAVSDFQLSYGKNILGMK